MSDIVGVNDRLARRAPLAPTTVAVSGNAVGKATGTIARP